MVPTVWGHVQFARAINLYIMVHFIVILVPYNVAIEFCKEIIDDRTDINGKD